MRKVEEAKVWKRIRKDSSTDSAQQVQIDNIIVDLALPCLVVGGRNGAGKTRLLRSIAGSLGRDSLLLDLHALCEQALSVLRSRDDFDDMLAEFGTVGPDEERQDDVQRVVGREYDTIEWYALEVEPGDRVIADRFRWGGEQALLPYFAVQHRGVSYSSRDMGLGEFSVHLLFWILEQYRHADNLTLLLDEPDAYLPPIGASALLVRVLRLCLDRGWRLVMTTHSSEMISQAVENQVFMLLRVDDNGEGRATHCMDDPGVAETLLARPAVRYTFFVEDESAFTLAVLLLENFDRRLALRSEVVWGNGSGYIRELQTHFPRPPTAAIQYIYLYDGDMREKKGVASKQGRWPAIFLPTHDDPDALFRSVRSDIDGLARKLVVPAPQIERFLDSIEGLDKHDWVNEFCTEYGRVRGLRTLAEL